MQVDNMADNTDITQSPEANHHPSTTDSRNTRPRRVQKVNGLCTDNRAL